MNENIANLIQNTASVLAHDKLEKRSCALPTIEILSDVLKSVFKVVFPGYYGDSAMADYTLQNHLAINIETIYVKLKDQVERAFKHEQDQCEATVSEDICIEFLSALPELKRLLMTDVEAMYRADPAASNNGEVIFCYPSIIAMTHHRVAHKLHQLGVPLVPRIISEIAHSKTGIDIHPAAKIGEYFAIDHGTGVVIGETCVIGKGVVLYQGVTLGARGFRTDEQGNIINEPRHPIIQDNVTIYSNSSILGRITIGQNSIIGGNTWVTEDVAPNTKISQSQIRKQQ